MLVKRLILSVAGELEKDFVFYVLRPYLIGLSVGILFKISRYND